MVLSAGSKEVTPLSSTLSLVILIAILAVAAILAIVVYIKVQRRDWLNSFRLGEAKNLTRNSDGQQGPVQRPPREGGP